MSLIDANRRLKTRKIEKNSSLSNAVDQKHMKRLAIISKNDIWVANELSLLCMIFVFLSLLFTFKIFSIISEFFKF